MSRPQAIKLRKNFGRLMNIFFGAILCTDVSKKTAFLVSAPSLSGDHAGVHHVHLPCSLISRAVPPHAFQAPETAQIGETEADY